jgi:ABC-type Na+ transport system ATPase subunit NatA
MIRNTQKAIKYYELAIQNAQHMLAFNISQDEKLQSFINKCRKDDLIIIFYSHTQEFSCYDSTLNLKEDYFCISDGEIIYYEENTFYGEVQVAEELLSIVSKFYEE